MKKNNKKSNEEKFLVVKDRLNIYEDFTINLLYYINRYYLDSKTLNNDEDINNHFNFCYNKTCDDFLDEEIDFSNNDELREYFATYYYNQVYKYDDEINIKSLESFWRSIFDVDNITEKNIMNVFVELYLIFDVSIEEKKNEVSLNKSFAYS
ncbi:MAG: hypothetical protein ACOC2U_00660 [bacterium]